MRTGQRWRVAVVGAVAAAVMLLSVGVCIAGPVSEAATLYDRARPLPPHYVTGSLVKWSNPDRTHVNNTQQLYSFRQASGTPFTITIARVTSGSSTPQPIVVSIYDASADALSSPVVGTMTMAVHDRNERMTVMLPPGSQPTGTIRNWVVAVSHSGINTGLWYYRLSYPEEDDNSPGATGPLDGEVQYGSVNATELANGQIVSGDTHDVYSVVLSEGNFVFSLRQRGTVDAQAAVVEQPKIKPIYAEKPRFQLGFMPASWFDVLQNPSASGSQGDLSVPIRLKVRAYGLSQALIDVQAMSGSADYELSWERVDEFETNTDLAIDGPDVAAYAGAKALVDGVLTCDFEEQDLAGMPIQIEYLEGETWKPLVGATAVCESDGAFDLSIGPIGKTRKYRARFMGWGSLDSCYSEPITINARLKLPAPKVTGRLKAGNDITLTGKIPNLNESIVLIIETKYVKNRKLLKGPSVKVTTTKTGTFSGKIKLLAGAYQMRLYCPKSAKYDASASKYIAVRVLRK